jgi:hypothetical protein
MLALLSGDKVLSGVGKQLNARTQAKATGLAKARQNIEQRKAARAMQDERLAAQADQHAATLAAQKAWQEKQEARWATQDTLSQDRFDETQRQFNERIDQMEKDRVQALEIANQKTASANAKTQRAEVRNLQGDLEKAGVPQLKAAMVGVDSILDKYIDDSGKVIEDIPGQGKGKYFPKSTMFIGEDGVKLRSNYASVKNQVLKMRSGAAVTNPEMGRLDEELANNPLASDQDFVDAYKNLQRQVELVDQHIRGGYSAEVNDAFDSNVRDRDLVDRMGDVDVTSVNNATMKTKSGTPVTVIR